MTCAAVLGQTSKNIDMLWSALTRGCVDSRRHQLLMLVLIVAAQLPLPSSNRKSLKTSQKALLGIETSNHIDFVLRVVCANSHVLSTDLHVARHRELTSFVNDEASSTCDACLPLKSPHNQELIVWYVDCFKVVRNIVLRKIGFVLEWKSLKLPHFLVVVVAV